MFADDRLPDYPVMRAGERSAQAVQTVIDNGKYIATVAICAVLCGAAAVYAWNATEKANRSEERADLLQYYVMELDGKLMARGVIKPAESFAAQQSKESKP